MLPWVTGTNEQTVAERERLMADLRRAHALEWISVVGSGGSVALVAMMFERNDGELFWFALGSFLAGVVLLVLAYVVVARVALRLTNEDGPIVTEPADRRRLRWRVAAGALAIAAMVVGATGLLMLAGAAMPPLGARL